MGRKGKAVMRGGLRGIMLISSCEKKAIDVNGPRKR